MRIAGFSSPFDTSGDLGLGLASILGGDAGGTPNAASVLTASNAPTGAFGALAAAGKASQTPTTEALTTGKLTVKQHNVIASIASTTKPTTITWSNTGTEPTVVAKMRSYGWIKLVKPSFDTKTRLVASATYSLTPVGQAIARRTGGGQASAGAGSVNAIA